ncbi:helix-turn-helix transcriptional regulator [bacterium]|nr:helix-turn-helix transcriptional regulator [bacterium]
MNNNETRFINFGKYIQSSRELRKWSIKDLSNKSGLSQWSLKRIEQGNLKRIKLSHIIQLASAFKVKFTEIIKALDL